MGTLSFVLHGHFYQPPRENPWTGRVPLEAGAAPWHDWNARIDAECYRANAFGRIVDDAHRIRSMVNNYAWMSFNVGPTLMQWLEVHDPLTVRRMLEADRESARRNRGHGNAIAQAYNHVILPLANRRDRRTQIRWGLVAFRHRFGRDAEALWLPETAANHDVLDDLIDHGLRYAILAPGQAGRLRPLSGGRWKKVGKDGIDTSRPHLYRHRDDPARTLAIFFYDGDLAHAISFEDALADSATFVDRVRLGATQTGDGSLVHAAADGETAGHHVAWGDRVLAHALARALPGKGFEVTNYGRVLDAAEFAGEVELYLGPRGEGSSWSCAHGVGRWIRDCGCRIDPRARSSQEWRSGLREAMDLLRDRAMPWFEEEASALLQDPWAARDDYITVLLEPTGDARSALLERHGREGLDRAGAGRAMALLELQHQLLLQYTSCGWFFDDIGGLEGRQVLRYAARALEIWEELGGDAPRGEFLALLATARSNDLARGDGRRIFEDILARDRAATDSDPSLHPAFGALEEMAGTDVAARIETLRGEGLSTESIRMSLEEAIEECVADDAPAAALAAIERAVDLDFPLHLHRAQEAWVDRAPAFTDRYAARQLGEALGLAPDLCVSAMRRERDG